MPQTVSTVATKPFEGQKPGTSGLRKRVTVFQQPHYLANFTQSTFDALGDEVKGSTIVVSGDGRFYNDKAMEIIAKIAAANGVARMVVGADFLMSTPCVSACIRQRKALGGIILTASHNPGGPEGDFGFKYNISNGGPAPANVTNAIFDRSKVIESYKIITDDVKMEALKPCEFSVGDMVVEVIDACQLYTDLMKDIFDFEGIKAFIAKTKLKVCIDGMHGVAGPFAKSVFCGALGLPEDSLMNCVPKPDFGGGHPDPNLTYAHELVHVMGLDDGKHDDESSIPDFGAAADGDADRNMIVGNKWFVTPSDSVAIITAFAKESIPYFQKKGLAGVARSMPTSGALDRVSAKLGIQCHEVPTGWKFFGNLMDGNMAQICGEESFGTGSDHVREKDGLWAMLAWLSILAYVNRDYTPEKGLVSIKDVVEGHWKTYGRNYYTRYDYEEVDASAAADLMSGMVDMMVQQDKKDALAKKCADAGYTLKTADEFTYKDPVDSSVAEHQGHRFLFEDGSRIIFRKSGTGSVGATIRMYIEKYAADASKINMPAKDALDPLVKLALDISNLRQQLGREKPTVIT